MKTFILLSILPLISFSNTWKNAKESTYKCVQGSLGSYDSGEADNLEIWGKTKALATLECPEFLRAKNAVGIQGLSVILPVSFATERPEYSSCNYRGLGSSVRHQYEFTCFKRNQ